MPELRLSMRDGLWSLRNQIGVGKDTTQIDKVMIAILQLQKIAHKNS
jgi:hypothetical protein